MSRECGSYPLCRRLGGCHKIPHDGAVSLDQGEWSCSRRVEWNRELSFRQFDSAVDYFFRLDPNYKEDIFGLA